MPLVNATLLEFIEYGTNLGQSFLKILFPLLRKGIRKKLFIPFIEMLYFLIKFINPLQKILFLFKHFARHDLELRLDFLDNNLDDSDED